MPRSAAFVFYFGEKFRLAIIRRMSPVAVSRSSNSSRSRLSSLFSRTSFASLREGGRGFDCGFLVLGIFYPGSLQIVNPKYESRNKLKSKNLNRGKSRTLHPAPG